MIGTTVSHYRILDKLGEGGMGVVYRAEDTRLRRPVALKFLPPELSRDPDAKKRFLREARAASQLQHRNICAIHDIDEGPDGLLFLSMDCYEGETLQVRLKRGQLSSDEVVDIAGQMAAGLAHAHAHGVVHRDLKPGNVMITNSGEVKILDFGLAKATDETRVTVDGTILGTPCYMSPEQAQGADADHRTDLWSLGVVIYEMLAGRSPFQGGSPAAVIHRILNDDPVPLSVYRSDVPRGLNELIESLLRRNLNDRTQSAVDCAGSLRHLDAIAESKPSLRRVNPGALWRGAVIVASLALIALAIFVGTRLNPIGGSSPDEDPTLAVLLFRNLSDPGDLEYLAPGVTEDIITNLSAVQGLSVLSRSAVERYREQAADPREVRRALDCDYVLEGSLRAVADSLRMTARLVDARTGTQIWARSYDGSLQSVFALQDSIQTGVAVALGLIQPDGGASVVSPRWTRNVEAYSYYLAARELRRTVYDPQYWGLPRFWYEKALALDPFYVPALAGMATTLTVMNADNGRCFPDRHEQALQLARAAKDLDPTFADAWAAEGGALLELDYEAAVRSRERSVELSPGLPELRRGLGNLYWKAGRDADAERELRKAFELDPYYAYPATYLAFRLIQANEHEKAQAALDEGLEYLPGDPLLRWTQAYLSSSTGDLDSALAQHKSIIADHPGHWDSYRELGRLYREQESYAEADSVYADIVARWPNYPRGLNLAGWHFLDRGNHERAEQLFRKAIQVEEYALLARYNLARCLHRQGRPEEAQAEIDEIARIWPADYEAARYLGMYYRFFAADLAEAESWFLKGREITTENRDLRHQLAFLYWNQSRYAEAVELFEESVAFNPRDHEAYRWLAQVHRLAGQMELAVAAAERTIEIEPSSSGGWLVLGNAHGSAGNRYQAAAAYEKAVECGSPAEKSRAQMNLAVILAEEGRFERAVSIWEQVVEARPDAEIAWMNIVSTTWSHLQDDIEARSTCEELIELDLSPRSLAFGCEILALIEAESGYVARADSLFDKAEVLYHGELQNAPNSPTNISDSAILHARRGHEAPARQLAANLIEQQSESVDARQTCVSIFALLDDHEAALEQLEAAITLGLDTTAQLEADRDLAELRRDPRFAELIARVK